MKHVKAFEQLNESSSQKAKTITIDSIDLDSLLQQKTSLLLLIDYLRSVYPHPALPEDLVEEMESILDLLDEIQYQLEDPNN